MSRREEVERRFSVEETWLAPLPGIATEYIRDNSKSVMEGPDLSLEQACDLLNAAYPTRYTPREEVTEGWWSAKHRREKGRHIVYVCSTPHSTDLTLRAWGPGCMIGSRLDEFTDFLPVPAWLVEGVGKQPK